jgi:hypothetical protein
MGKRDPRVDAYIAKAGDFAKPILNQLRDAAIEWMSQGKSRNWKYL